MKKYKLNPWRLAIVMVGLYFLFLSGYVLFATEELRPRDITRVVVWFVIGGSLLLEKYIGHSRE